MDFKPILTELEKQTPNRDVIIEELDVLTDPLRAGYPTTEIIDELFSLFTKLINFSQWHIQQDTLSCAKYIFENSTLNLEEKKQALLKHTDFTEHLGVLLSDPKREVREMAAQCIGNLAIEIGPSILDDEFKLNKAIFHPSISQFPLEGQQMALGRLATAFRFVSNESLKLILQSIIDDSNFNAITNQSENGYVYWYSTRALLLFCTSQIDYVRIKYKKQFDESYKYIIANFKDDILKCAISRLSHHYSNVRRSAANVISSIFVSIEENREQFIDSLLPKSDQKWISVEGHLSAVSGCIASLTKPLDAEYVEELAKKLVLLLKDPISCDSAPITQKGNANGWAGRTLVKLLYKHDPALYERYVHPSVQYLLDSPVAALIDAGVICLAELKGMNKFDIEDLYLSAFKDIFHASFPIRDLSRRTIPADDLIQNRVDELIEILAKYAKSVDSEVRESVCKALQTVKKNNANVKFNENVMELIEEMIKDENENVIAAALDLYRLTVTPETVSKIPEIVRSILTSDGDESLSAAIRLVKSSVELFRDLIINKIYLLSPILAFHAITSMSPNVSTTAQQLLILLASDTKEFDEELIENFKQLDIDCIGPDELDEIIDTCNGNANAPASMLKVLIERFCEDLGVESIEEVMSTLNENDESNEEIIKYILSGQKEEIVNKLAFILTKATELTDEEFEKVMQVLVDVYADEQIDFESKRPLLFALNELRLNPKFKGKLKIPEPTPFSTTHASETFAKTQSI
ncbi:hypothetical protein GPJ56_009559 [Histomonas meleagridis]|uniref:uncharacterized protein n=1 Tax=Histomonas meleagridis TaxID=135588 RepID=UPI003559B84A|nr:hypothetical protein GPJ56_009559 [Histomonas meleagridis]KAH0797160.1 hypothetical protein GO595_010018 [Histomonas meleagridis]